MGSAKTPSIFNASAAPPAARCRRPPPRPWFIVVLVGIEPRDRLDHSRLIGEPASSRQQYSISKDHFTPSAQVHRLARYVSTSVFVSPARSPRTPAQGPLHYTHGPTNADQRLPKTTGNDKVIVIDAPGPVWATTHQIRARYQPQDKTLGVTIDPRFSPAPTR